MRAVLTTTPNTTLTHTMQRYQATACVNCQRVKCNSGTEIVHSINHVYYFVHLVSLPMWGASLDYPKL